MSHESRRRFRELMATTPERLDLATLLIAAETSSWPDLDAALEHGLARFDALADLVPEYGRDDQRLQAALGAFHGETQDYESLSSSLMPSVMRTKRGLPIMLSTLWTEVARRVGIDAYGVALPGHFVVCLGDAATFRSDAIDGSRVLVDPWRGGTLVPYDRARDIVESAGYVFRRGYLAPADPVQTIARILANIRAWAQHPVRAATRLWAIDLALELPEPPVTLLEERAFALRDLGYFALAARWMDEFAQLQGSDQAREQVKRIRAHLN